MSAPTSTKSLTGNEIRASHKHHPASVTVQYTTRAANMTIQKWYAGPHNDRARIGCSAPDR